MLWFNPVKQHGFIRTDEDERLRVDEEGFAVGQILGERCRGTRVSFDRAADGVGARAVNVAAVPLVAERRARSRRRR
jgi:cold shock CspA family protein